MDYLKLVIRISDKHQERLMADLSEQPYNGFQRCEGDLVAYIDRKNFGNEGRQWLQRLLDDYPGDSLIKSEEVIADQNWNKKWERSIKPNQIGNFWVAPSWTTKEVPENKIPLIINPQMSFGTGHHETTRLILNMLPDVIRPGVNVVDAGTGTGILAIAAAKLGAKEVLAFDTDKKSIRNAKENIAQNGCTNCISLHHGSAEVLPPYSSSDLVLANIQLNPILGMLGDFAHALQNGGRLVLSGLLEKNLESVKEKAVAHHLVLQDKHTENKWMALKLKKLADE